MTWLGIVTAIALVCLIIGRRAKATRVTLSSDIYLRHVIAREQDELRQRLLEAETRLHTRP